MSQTANDAQPPPFHVFRFGPTHVEAISMQLYLADGPYEGTLQVSAVDCSTYGGANDVGQSDVPPGTYQALSVAWATSCALTATGEARCWGEGETLAAPPGEFIAISAGGSYACGIRPDSTVECWGLDDRGQATPPAGKRLHSISAGAFHACGVRADDFGVECWGENANGEASPPPEPFRMVSATNSTTCGITATLKLKCWGRRF